VKSIRIVAATAVIALAACATTPAVSPQVMNEARARVESLASNPLAAEAANDDLAAARSALGQAEQAQAKHEDAELVAHLAYLARRNAEIGLERVHEAEARQRIAKSEAERNAVVAQARAAEAQAAKAEAQVSRESALQAHAELEDLQHQYEALAAKQTERGMVLTLGDVLFDTAQATLKPGAATTIERLATFLNQNTGTRIRIEGHTDSVGTEAYNEELSRRRAQAVADALTDRGIARDRIDVAARGEGFPVVGNETAAGRQQNRRVEIVFSNPSGSFATGPAAVSAVQP
jgi:outer membrane protein OmpA-like peptidoglycan-associated protein